MASDELTKMIDNLVETKTFGLDAIDGVKALRDKAADLEKKLKAADTANVEARRNTLELEGINKTQTDRLVAWEKRLFDLTTREAKITDLEKTVAVETTRAATLDSCMSRMLANRSVRESFTSSVPLVTPPTYPGGPHNTTWQTETKNTTKEET